MDSMVIANKGNVIPVQRANIGKREISIETEMNQSQIPAVVQTTVGVHTSEQTQDQAIAELQKAIDVIQGPKKSLEISVHEKTNAIMIKVMNKETGDLIREVPPEKLLDLAARMMEITGILIDKRI
ncbi:flagellar protein FlaG [Paenibacillus sp. CMAA1364]